MSEQVQVHQLVALKQELASLQKEVGFLRTVMETIDAMVAVVDLNTGRIIYTNKAHELSSGYSAEELGQLSVAGDSPLLPEEEMPKFRNYLQRMIAGERPLRWEIWGVTKGGQRVRLAWTGTVTFDGDRNPQYSIGSGIEITELIKAQDALREAKEQAENATRLKDKFLALVSHDLKSPLISLLAFLDLLKSDSLIVLPGEYRPVLGEVDTRCREMVGMIDSLLSFNRFQSGRIGLRSSLIDVFPFVQEIILGMESFAENKRISLINDIPDDMAIYADRDLIFHVVSNLISNAIKFSYPQSPVVVYSPDGKSIAVKDSGVGIRQDLLPNLFRMDVRTSTPGTAGETGHGFGLPLCREIVEAHQGSLWAESAEGQGSVFYLRLPSQNETGG